MKSFDKIVSKTEEIVITIAILLMAVILIGGVISRSVFNASWTFTEEVSGALNILVTFFAIGYCAREARHISMSIVFDLVDEKKKKAMMLLITGVSCLVMVIMCYLSIGYTQSVYNLGRVTPALRFPVWITILPLPIGFVLGALEYLRCFILNLKNEDLYISSKFKFGENTDEALGVADDSNSAD